MQFRSRKVSFNDVCILGLVLMVTVLISMSLILLTTVYRLYC